VSLIFAQLAHSIGLNDVSDALRLQRDLLSTVRGAEPPSRNGLSHANRERPAEMGEKLFWQSSAAQDRGQSPYATGPPASSPTIPALDSN
jgi:hypothetical protein